MMSALYGNVVSPFGMWSSYLYDVYPVGMWSLLLVCGARIYMITPPWVGPPMALGLVFPV